MGKRIYDIAIVGSGTGGSTVARGISKSGRSVIVIEKGTFAKEIGGFWKSVWHYEARKNRLPLRSKEGVLIWTANMAGGSSVYSCGNGPRTNRLPLSSLGVSIENELKEAEEDLGVAPMDPDLLSDGSRRMFRAARELNYNMEYMPKFINFKRCRKCGQCIYGCRYGAKWTGLKYLREATKNGVEVLCNTKVNEIVTKGGKVTGLRAIGRSGPIEISANMVILSAGGLHTPVILQRSGISSAGSGLFVDLFVTTYAITKGINQIGEPTMPIVDIEFHKDKGFILSPYVNFSPMIRIVELGLRGITLRSANLLGIMTKIGDSSNGQVFVDGTISKSPTQADMKKLEEGSAISKSILARAAQVGTFLVTKPMGAHPGGTAAIGKVVNTNLQTEIDGLYVCDSSVLPESPGMPPILTLVALGKRLAKTLG